MQEKTPSSLLVQKHQAVISKPTLYISMIYILILFASAVLGNKIIWAPLFGSISAGSLTGPFWFLLSDITAEVYGYETSKSIFIAAMICELVFIGITELLLHLPSPTWWHYQKAYNYVEGALFLEYVCQFIGITIAWYINVKLLTRWKKRFLRGSASFPVRSIGASGVGETIFSVISVGLSSIGFVPWSSLYKVVLASCCIKWFFSLLCAYPAVLVVILLRKIENFDKDDCSSDFRTRLKVKKRLCEMNADDKKVEQYVVS